MRPYRRSISSAVAATHSGAGEMRLAVATRAQSAESCKLPPGGVAGSGSTPSRPHGAQLSVIIRLL